MKRLLLIVLCALAFQATASHIVGGEIELLHIPNGLDGIERYQYRLNLIYYFDEDHGAQANKTQDKTIYVDIFRVSDNALMLSQVPIQFDSQTPVNYTQAVCSKDGIKTTRQFYTTIIKLPSDKFNDPQGYYISWERCCRNYQIINNIFSNDPLAPGSIPAGQTFYLKFPPVVKNGVPFTNSSVRSFAPLTDFACPFQRYYKNFAGVDDDGDSIVYSMVTPYSTHSSNSYNIGLPQPYPTVTWTPSYSLQHIMNGRPDLQITPKGYLSVTPGYLTGLYVFAVRCEEFRNGEKIGETRRDFQLYVSNNCPDADPPQVIGKKKGGVSYTTVNKSLSVSFSNSTPDEDRCIDIQVYDPDVLKVKDGYLENITMDIIPINFTKDISDLIPSTDKAFTITKANSTHTLSICFDKCPYVDGPFQIGVIAYDDACALPLGDTLIVTVNIELPPDNRPHFTTPDVVQTLYEDDIESWPIRGIDEDGDPLNVKVITDGFTLPAFGLSLSSAKTNINGLYKDTLTWNTNCVGFDFANRSDFMMDIIIENKDVCNFSRSDTMTFDINVKTRKHDPVIDSDLTPDTKERLVRVNKQILESLAFNVTGTEEDKDHIKLSGHGEVFALQKYSMTFPSAEDDGFVSSPFQWDILCDRVNLADKDSFDVQFILVDRDSKCRIYRADTLDVIVKVSTPDNTKPTLTIRSLNPDVPFVNDALAIHLGQQISLGLQGKDLDTAPVDHVSINLIDASGNVIPKGYDFKPGAGAGTAEASFNWKPDCSIFENNSFENDYVFTFNVLDDRCITMTGDTVAIAIKVQDVASDDKLFLPPNFITPNADGWNDYFAMEGIDLPAEVWDGRGDPNAVISLPKDNCIRHFEHIRIYNRWGKEIFFSSSRSFRWYAPQADAGVYFYYITYSDRIFKGTVSVRF